MTPSLILLLLAACAGEGPPAADPTPTAPAEPAPIVPATGPSLVLVTLDTTRADRIGAYGHAAAHTPNIDAFAREGVRFARAYAAVPLTTASHATMLTGLYPPRHGVRNNGDAILAEEANTLAERLHAAGYRTAASVSAFVTTRVWNLDQGFDTYFDEVQTGLGRGRWGQERPADGVVDDLEGWLTDPEAGQGPFFLWAHFYDAHHPHTPPPPFDTELEDPYDGEIAFVDSQVGRLRELVDKAAGPAGANWILVADHGEAMNKEHGEVTHGLFVFDPTMRVPFIVRPATPLAAPQVVEDVTVSGVDVTPTALGLLGVPVGEGLDGRDLSPALSGTVLEHGPVYMECEAVQERFGYAPEVAIAEGPLKLMDTPSPRLFDVVKDPGETTNLVDELPQVLEPFRAFRHSVTDVTPLTAEQAPAPELVQQLAALGYMSNDFDVDPSAGELDAKDHLDTISRLESLRTEMVTSKDRGKVEAAYREIIDAEPQIAEARMGLARALSAQGKDAEAEQTYREALERQPHSAILRVNLANSIAAQGHLAEGLAEMQAVLAQVPGDSLAQVGVLRMMTDLKREDEAFSLAKEWLDAQPGDGGLQAHLGVIMAKRGDPVGAEPLLRASLTDEVPRQLVHQALAVIEMGKGHPRLAVYHYESEIKYFPTNPELYRSVGDIRMGLKEYEKAAEAYQKLAEAKPDPQARRAWAQAVFNLTQYLEAGRILAPALKAAPDDPDVLMLQANILAKTGHMAEGEALAKRANELKKAQVEAIKEAREAGEGPPRRPRRPPPVPAPATP